MIENILFLFIGGKNIIFLYFFVSAISRFFSVPSPIKTNTTSFLLNFITALIIKSNAFALPCAPV
jgi:hypothetical protein